MLTDAASFNQASTMSRISQPDSSVARDLVEPSIIPIEIGRPFRSMSAGVALPVGTDDYSFLVEVGSSGNPRLVISAPSFLRRMDSPRNWMR